MSITRAQQLVERNIKLPTLPHVVARISALASDANSSAEEMGAAIQQDAPIAAKVLKIANSAYYGVQDEVVATDRAASILGFDLLKSIVTQASVMAEFEHLSRNGRLDLDRLWRHSILCGHASAFLARHCKAVLGLEPSEFHVVGLLHDVGKVILLESIADEYVQVLETSETTGRPLFSCERDMLGFAHTDVGAMLAMRWNLPSAVARAIQFHHGPREAVALDPVVCLIANVNLLLHRLFENQHTGVGVGTAESEAGAPAADPSGDAPAALSAEDRAAAAATFDDPSLRLLGIGERVIDRTIDHLLETAQTIEV